MRCASHHRRSRHPTRVGQRRDL